MQVYAAALDYKLGQIADAVDRRHVEAKLVRRGLAVAVVPGQAGRTARPRGRRRRDRPRARAARARRSPSRCPSSSIRSTSQPPTWLLLPAGPRRSVGARPARLRGDALEAAALADGGAARAAGGAATRLSIAGPGADAWFARLRKTGRPRAGRRERSHVVGSDLDRPEQAGARASMCRRPPRRRSPRRRLAVNRTAQLVGRDAAAGADDGGRQAIGIERRLGSYTTLNAGTYNRITNLQLGDRSS